eukprot:1105782-Amphidinium_carterae.2
MKYYIFSPGTVGSYSVLVVGISMLDWGCKATTSVSRCCIGSRFQLPSEALQCYMQTFLAGARHDLGLDEKMLSDLRCATFASVFRFRIQVAAFNGESGELVPFHPYSCVLVALGAPSGLHAVVMFKYQGRLTLSEVSAQNRTASLVLTGFGFSALCFKRKRAWVTSWSMVGGNVPFLCISAEKPKWTPPPK